MNKFYEKKKKILNNKAFSYFWSNFSNWYCILKTKKSFWMKKEKLRVENRKEKKCRKNAQSNHEIAAQNS